MKRLVLAPSSAGVTNTLFSRRSTVKALRFPTATIVTRRDSSMTVRWSFAVSTRRTFVESGFWVSSFVPSSPASLSPRRLRSSGTISFGWYLLVWSGRARNHSSEELRSLVSRVGYRRVSPATLPRYLPRSGNFELPVANFTRARTVRERMNPLNATSVKNNLTIPASRHQEVALVYI